jgi:hypothetical protein
VTATSIAADATPQNLDADGNSTDTEILRTRQLNIFTLNKYYRYELEGEMGRVGNRQRKCVQSIGRKTKSKENQYEDLDINGKMMKRQFGELG